MRFTDAAKKLLEQLEGCRLDVYPDAGGIPTIGVGHTGPEVVPGLVWTQQQCDDTLAADLQGFIDSVGVLVRGAPLSDDQFSALVIFAFNVGIRAFGASSARRLVLDGDYAAVPGAMALYNKVKDKRTGRLVINTGLVKRRVAEAQLWNGVA